MKLFVILFLIIISQASYSQEITINLDGNKLSSTTLDQIKQMKTANLEYYSATIMRAEPYKGVPTLDLIAKFYPDLRKLAEIEFVTDNGINPVISMEKFFKTNSILAYERSDGQKFERFSKKEKILVPLSPLYLVWEVNRKSSQEEKVNLKSLYQIRGINLYSVPHKFGLTEEISNEILSLGIDTYKSQCISCHAVGDLGGNYSYSLIQRKTLQTKGSEYIKKYVLNSAAIYPKTKMIQFPQFHKDEKTLNSLIEFLEYIDDPISYFKKKNPTLNPANYKELLKVVEEIKKEN